MTARTFTPVGSGASHCRDATIRVVITANLHTGRLDLAVPAAVDAEAIFAILGDPATVTHNPSDLLADVAEAHELVGRWIQHWQARGFGYGSTGCSSRLATTPSWVVYPA